MKRYSALIILVGCFLLCSQLSCFAALGYQEVYESTESGNRVLLVVNSSIYTPIASSLNQYIADLEAEGYHVTMIRYTSGTAQELKDYIKLLNDLKGVVFIGDLPVAWYENANTLGSGVYEVFPEDRYYMDLDGMWLDADRNGIYDGDYDRDDRLGTFDLRSPEIWLGRLTASGLSHPTMDEVALFKNYFRKNHNYRSRNNLSIKHRGLIYVDDEFARHRNRIELGSVYSDIEIPEGNTTSENYKLKLKENYEWIHLLCHSGPFYHGFYNTAGRYEGSVSYYEGSVSYKDIRDIDPETLFYNLATCRSCLYTNPNYLGGHYVFAGTNGLVAMGCTRVVFGVKSFYKFYGHLGPSKRGNMGQAFLQSLSPVGTSYGMTLLGDPTLSLDPPIASVDSISLSGETVIFNGSGKINNGEIANYSWRSDKDGFLSDRASFSTTTLSPGEHAIYFKVRDGNGRWSSEAKTTMQIIALPTVVSLAPSSGTFNPDTRYTFTTVHADNDGYRDIRSANLLINTGPAFGAFFAHYRRDQNLLFLYNNSTRSRSGRPGSSNVIETPYAKLYCAETTVSGSGNNLTIRWVVSFKSKLAGTKNVYVSTGDRAGGTSGWQQKGTITIANSAPRVSQVSPYRTRSGRQVTIYGSDFGERNSNSRVHISGNGSSEYASIVSWSNNRIRFTAPGLRRRRWYRVRVSTGGGWSNNRYIYYY